MMGLGMGLSLSEAGSGVLVIPVTSGLIAHWDATVGVSPATDGSAVTTWTDSVSSIVGSGTGPVYRATGAPNHRPAIEFGAAHGATSGFSISAGLPTGGTRTFICATKPSALATGGTLVSLGSGAAGVWVQHMNLAGNNYVAGDSGNNDTIVAAPANASATYTHRYQATVSLTVRINGVAQTVAGPALAGTTFGPAGVLGNRFPGANQPWEGVIMEIAIYNRLLSDAECALVEAYYASKWY